MNSKDKITIARLRKALQRVLALVPRHDGRCSFDVYDNSPESDYCACDNIEVIVATRKLLAELEE